MGLRGPGSKKRKDAPAPRRRRLPWRKQGLSRVQRIIAFLEWLPVTKGILAGKRMKLLPNQREFIQAVYGGRGRRKVRIAIKSEPRGNGKTGLIAGLCLAHLLGPEAEPRGEVYSAAIDKIQAGILFKEMKAIIEAVPEFDERVNIQRFQKIIEVLDGDGAGSVYESLSADVRRAHGLAPSLWVYDEFAQAKTAELLDNLMTAMGKRSESLGLVISTQAATDQHPLSVMIDDALKGDDPSVHCQLTAAPADCDPLDEATWKAVNPAWGKFLDIEEFRSQARRAARVPSFLPRFCNLRLNMRIEAEARFIAAADWRACAGTAETKGRCLLGLDLSTTTDLTALGAFWPETGAARIWAWAPKDTLGEASRRDGVPYETWARQGLLETTPGRAVDKSFIVHRIGEIVAEFDVQACAFDRWRIDEVKRLLADEDIRLAMEPWGQGFRDMSPALDALEALVLTGKLQHPGNPVLDWAVANAVVVSDPAANRKLDKSKATGRIDPLVALTMAVGLSARTAPKKASIYRTRGLLTVGHAG
ncbi:MAG: terminase large subunit [Hyphomicrobiaceae bacterium]|nr:terminase large subunit [Hyphomicrobiaceae bacterium]